MLIRVLACVIALDAGASRAQDPGRDEMRTAIETGMTLASGINGNVAIFRAAVAQYGPLDLSVQSRDAPPRTIHGMREYFLGAVGQAAGVDPLALIKALESCACDTARRDSAVAILTSARAAARAVGAANGAGVIAAWPGGWAVYTLAYDGSGFVMRQPSPALGLLPWQTHPVTREQAERSLGHLGTSVDAVSRLVADMTAHGIAAAARMRMEMCASRGRAVWHQTRLGSSSSRRAMRRRWLARSGVPVIAMSPSQALRLGSTSTRRGSESSRYSRRTLCLRRTAWSSACGMPNDSQ